MSVLSSSNHRLLASQSEVCATIGSIQTGQHETQQQTRDRYRRDNMHLELDVAEQVCVETYVLLEDVHAALQAQQPYRG